MNNTSQVNLKSATFSLMGLIALFENDHVNESIRSDLVSVRDNIEKQIEALSIIDETKDAYLASTPPTIIQEKNMENTYRIEEEVTVKRFQRTRKRNQVLLLPENSAYEPIEVDLAEQSFAIEGLSVGVIRQQI